MANSVPAGGDASSCSCYSRLLADNDPDLAEAAPVGRNGVRSKTVLTEIGPVEIEVPRDVDASFTPQIVRKRQRRLAGSMGRLWFPAELVHGDGVIVGHNSGKLGLRGTVGDLQN